MAPITRRAAKPSSLQIEGQLLVGLRNGNRSSSSVRIGVIDRWQSVEGPHLELPESHASRWKNLQFAVGGYAALSE